MPKFTQDQREMAISTPLGPDELLLASMQGVEHLGRLYEYRVELLSEKPDIGFGAILGKPVSVRLDIARSTKRHFHGYVTDFAFTGSAGGLHTYQAVIRPWLWFLTRTSGCRVFQNLNAVDIVKQVFDQPGYSGLVSLRDTLDASRYQPRVYCVQYRETDFDFVSRLMEEEGIYYYFEHEADRHTLVLADSPASHNAIDGYGSLPFRADGSQRAPESVQQWRLGRAIASGKVQLRDYDFERSRTPLAESAQDVRQHDHAGLEQYDYPGRFVTSAVGAGYARNRLDALQVQGQRVQGAASARNLAVGGLFTLADHPRADQNREYLVVGSEVVLDAGGYDGSDSGQASFSCSFSAMSSSQTYRSPHLTPRPVVHGPQTATVVGDGSGDPVWTDKYGRVKVQFHWDREGQRDENSSCWLRVAQTAAGPGSGAVVLPRVGWEVVVGFLDGDPDQPLVIGCVHNDANMPPYTLPDARTQTVFRSHTHQGEGYNELRFDDKQDAEEIYVQAQRDFKRVVKNNDVLEVGLETQDPGDQTIKIHHDQASEIGHDRRIKVGNDQALEVGHDRSIKVENDQQVEIGNDLKVAIANLHELSIDGDETVSVGGNQGIDVGQDQSVSVGGAHKLKGKTCLIEGQTSIELKVGGSSIKIEASKITISAPQISVSSTGTGEFKASGPLTLQGAVVKIN